MNRTKWASRQYEAAQKGFYAPLEELDAEGRERGLIRKLQQRLRRQRGVTLTWDQIRSILGHTVTEAVKST